MGCFEFRLGGEGLLALFNVEGSTTGYGSLSASFTSSVLMDGGTLQVSIQDGTILQRGPARMVFEGSVLI